ncbi:recombinase family protein [Methylobacterium sp. SD21]|uniref:recombinase family protein n=1 Tax=Methylobacterium litchii TaxID=3138810 RepID=UPI00313D9046
MTGIPINTEHVAYSYIRMSTERQVTGDSLRRQLDMSREWAERHNVTLDGSLRDIGVSAFKGRNRREGALGRFLEMVEQGTVRRGSYLLVESLDRLSRDQVLEALSLFLEIIRSGITIVTLGDDQVYSQETVGNDWSKLIISLTIMARAHEESLRKSQRIQKSYEARRAMYAEGGYAFTLITPGWLTATKVGRGKYEFAFNEHAATVRRIFDMAANGMGQNAIAQTFNREGVPTFKSTSDGWFAGMVGRVLNGRDTLGEFQPNKTGPKKKAIPVGDPIQGYFPAVVTPEVWAKAQQQKRPYKDTGGRKGTLFTNLLSGLGKCEHCRGSMTVQSNTRRNFSPFTKHYITCSNRKRGKGCPEHARLFHYDKIEAAILDNVREFRLSEVLRQRQMANPVDALLEQIATTRSEIDNIARREARLLDQLEETDGDTAEIRQRLAQRKSQRADLEAALVQLERQKSDAELTASSQGITEADIARMREEWATADQSTAYMLRAKANAALRTFVDAVTFNSKHYTVTVIVMNGLRAYRFENYKLTGSFDLTDQLGDIKLGKIPTRSFTADGKTIDAVPEEEARLNKLLSRS